MPTRPRITFPGATYHIHSRGNRKVIIFEDDTDRRKFLEILADAVSRYDARCLDYTLMGTHYHSVLETPRGNVSSVMELINGSYARWINRRHRYWGHLFGARFSGWIVDNCDYPRALARYLARNPVEGGLSSDAVSWRWSGYRALAGHEPPPPFLCVDWLEMAFGCSSHSEAQARYRLFVNDDSQGDEPFPMSSVPVIGHRHFQESIRRVIPESQLAKLPRTFRCLGRPPLEQIFPLNNVSKAARNVAIQRAHEQYGYRLAEIAIHLGIHPSTASLVVRNLRRKGRWIPRQ
jgi:REP element-mobilizing transposase RayT